MKKEKLLIRNLEFTGPRWVHFNKHYPNSTSIILSQFSNCILVSFDLGRMESTICWYRNLLVCWTSRYALWSLNHVEFSETRTIFQKISLIAKKKFKKFWTRKKSGHIQVKMTMNQSKLLNGKIESSKLKKLVTLYGEIQNEIKNGKCVIPKVCSNCLKEFDERGQERVSVRVCGISSDLDRGKNKI